MKLGQWPKTSLPRCILHYYQHTAEETYGTTVRQIW